MRDRFFTTLNYTSVNEDWRTEAAALQLRADDRVLCITGTGARALDLLAVAPARVVAVDVNPAQSHLLALKIAALRELAFEDYTRFLGLHEADARWRRDVWIRLGRLLDPEPARYWAERPAVVAAGLLHAGRWERFNGRMARLARALRPGVIEALFEIDALEHQRRYVADVWDTRAWRGLVHLLTSGMVARLFFGDPAFHRRAAVPRGAYLYGRLRAALERRLARESFMVSLVLRGVLSPFDLPPHLTAAGAADIRGRLSGLEIRTADVGALLAATDAGTFTRFSLSDLPSFLEPPAFEALLAEVSRTAAAEARFCIREFLVRHPWPGARRGLAREPALEARLAAEDRSFAYDFIVGEVHRAA